MMRRGELSRWMLGGLVLSAWAGAVSRAAADDAPAPDVATVAPAGGGAGRGGRQPQAAVDGRGRIFVAFVESGAIRCARSDDGGRTYRVAEVGRADALMVGMRRGPRIAVAGDRAVITAIGGLEREGWSGDLLAWRSADAGATWAGPVRVNAVEGSAREGLHGMAAGPDGSVYCTWLDLRAKRTEVYGARSRDGGATWEPDRLVYRSPGGSVCECCHPSVSFGPDGDLVVMWRNQVEGARDLYLSRSTDGGSTFGPAGKLGRGTWPLQACPMDGGAVAVGPAGLVETAWMRAGEVFAARPGEPEHRLGRGVQAWTAVGPGGPFAVWLASRPGRVLAQVPGRDAPLTLADRGNDPVVAAGPGGRGPVVAAWEGEAGGIFAAVLDAPPASRPAAGAR
ncbi:BNR/Asp-box repeat protein [Aquisphaera giovannonii]|uniref:BNR/Asp-box repeat protein n=1 Tax=Aquisphaera giovannonii TaxID=406548 RepID=A0A5B9W3L7_9BACT|nr:sialidase family protein [Aquisphaera giovannonii]QEH35182.1 BNR/Asp-box repeat protein [Aquisphaera giovannonii]